MSDDKWTDSERIQVLEGQVSALEHLLATVINILGPDIRNRIVAVMDSVSRQTHLSPVQTRQGFFGTLDGIRDEVLEADALHGGDSDSG